MKDNLSEARDKVRSAYILLCGGYYEPKSERDVYWARELEIILERMNGDLSLDE